MKIPTIELIKLGFNVFKYTDENTYYEHSENDILLEDVYKDGSVNLDILIMAYYSMAELDGRVKAKELLTEFIETLD